MEKDKQRTTINPVVKKKHIQVLEECERLLKANREYCIMIGRNPSDYILGQNEILEDLITFINKL